MTTWGVTVGCLLLALGVSACGGDGGGATPTTSDRAPVTSTTTSTAPERQASTTTTAYALSSVEGEVEAAYLRSWDVYADAVYNLELDEQALAEVYADPLLSVLRSELESRISERRAAYVRVDHDYTIEITGSGTAAVIDTYVSHQVLIDPVTKEPIESDPNRTVVDAFTLRLVGEGWVVFDQQRVQ